jgi:DNA helicase II / ATP-dependent DNA helicase PcrA
LAAYIDSYLAQHPDVKAGQVLVLASRRRIGYAIRDALNRLRRVRNRGWEVLSFFREQALEPLRVQESFVLLTLLSNPLDRPALRAWLGIGDSQGMTIPYARLVDYCRSTDCPPRVALEHLRAGTLTLSRSAKLSERYALLTVRLSHLPVTDTSALVDALFTDGDPEFADIREVALLALPNASTPIELLEKMRILITQPEIPGEDGNVVRIMSLHKAKGLTARVVVIAGCMEGALPNQGDADGSDYQQRMLEEQRRLFYVGITRATEVLIISSPVALSFHDAMTMGIRIGRRKGDTAIVSASRFITELGSTRPQSVSGAQWRAGLGI